MLSRFSLMLDTRHRSAADRADLPVQPALDADAPRPLVRSPDLYCVSERPRDMQWDGREYVLPANHHGLIFYAFHGSARDEPAPRFRPSGLEASAPYALTFHDHCPTARPEEGSCA